MTIDHHDTFNRPRTASKTGAAVLDFFGADAHVPRKARRIALIGGFRPRKCGIATFTTDLYEQLRAHHPELSVDLHVVDNPHDGLDYPGVRGVIRAERTEDYRIAARRINEDAVDAVWLQHEYGIFGGPSGEMVLDLVDRIAAPLIVTLHTVLAEPSDRQRAILDHILRRASRVMVMSHHSQGLLRRLYHVAEDRIVVIPHGAPDRPLGRGEAFKARSGLAGRNVMMTFGLLGPGKGLETVIEALPAIVAAHPATVYRIVGATHPNLVAEQGEAYRDSLIARAEQLGVAGNIEWDNRFLETDELLDQLEACDIYLTPYPNLQQSTSGTLSFAVALGKAVVSTPYVHASELLADDVGVLIPPRSAGALADAVNGLLGDPHALAAMQRRAWLRGRDTIWPRFAEASAGLVESVVVTAPRRMPLLATPGFAGVRAMSDDTGMFQHSIGIVPDRRHGYCIDDNVRALMLMGEADAVPVAQRQRWATVYASFIQYAWNPDEERFRNFMAFDRTWCEDIGSEDSNGRTLWALGHAMGKAPDEGLRAWARQWFDIAVGPLSQVSYPRAVAFTMLGALEALRVDPGHGQALDLVKRGGEMLHALLQAGRRPDWAWFEAVLGYDNPRMPQALIEAAALLGRDDWLHSGLESLRFIAGQQVSAEGKFRAIGSETFHRPYETMPFDQQPLEAWAAIDAAAAAFRATGDPSWIAHAELAYRWYLGANDRGVALGDIVSGRCRDGITPQGANENCGAESILAFQLSHYAMQALARPGLDQGRLRDGQAIMAARRMGSALVDRTQQGAHQLANS
ncbi:glycosyltransferase family 4 protein [Novosphingobium sp. KCTC 2891]|uniref:glycosyltransferase family 4 protein n=1 Tax=Novosphingobium sp. KCTC 2891 TaxID=2989730 RepID=UPI00222248DA|nr:glycosyltransferase family 4 protein [Novosphingobium sp. KCTC 2891]MCW1383838.1 glycosyltransferase family 4 protein [Novosphingobium sp. KCTC 2891]